MTLAYVAKLGFKVQPTNIKAWKIDGFIFETFKMVLASFQVDNKLSISRFFKEIFLVTDIIVEVILSIPFLTFNNANMLFIERKFTWKSYTLVKVLLTTKQI